MKEETIYLLYVCDSTLTDGGTGSSNTGLIVGIVVSVVIGAALAVIVVVLLHRLVIYHY